MFRRTIMIFDQLDAELVFFVLEGDYTHLNKVYINSEGTEAEDELSRLMFLDDGGFRFTPCGEFPYSSFVPGETAVIVAGFLL